MSKTIKIISALLIAVLLIGAMSQVSLATYTEIIGEVDEKGQGKAEGMGDLTGRVGNIVKALRNIGAIVAVLVITILGIKYMIGSTEERSKYKESFIPLIVGIVVLVAAASIASALFSVAG